MCGREKDQTIPATVPDCQVPAAEKDSLTSDLSFTIISERKVTWLLPKEIMANDTKKHIGSCAEDVFAKRYAGTDIRELSASSGPVKSGIDQHFESKEAMR